MPGGSLADDIVPILQFHYAILVARALGQFPSFDDPHVSSGHSRCTMSPPGLCPIQPTSFHTLSCLCPGTHALFPSLWTLCLPSPSAKSTCPPQQELLCPGIPGPPPSHPVPLATSSSKQGLAHKQTHRCYLFRGSLYSPRLSPQIQDITRLKACGPPIYHRAKPAAPTAPRSCPSPRAVGSGVYWGQLGLKLGHLPALTALGCL